MENKWINVEINPPVERVLLLTTSKYILIGDLYLGQWRVDGKWNHNGKEWISDFKFEDITHWQPLPSPPRTKE